MEKKKNTGCNAASLTLGIISILAACFYYITYPAGILAIIFGAEGIKNSNSGVAKAGLITGIVGLSIATLLYLVFISIIVLNY